MSLRTLAAYQIAERSITRARKRHTGSSSFVGSEVGPPVRIRFPPRASHKRTRPHGYLTGGDTVTPTMIIAGVGDKVRNTGRSRGSASRRSRSDQEPEVRSRLPPAVSPRTPGPSHHRRVFSLILGLPEVVRQPLQRLFGSCPCA